MVVVGAELATWHRRRRQMKGWPVFIARLVAVVMLQAVPGTLPACTLWAAAGADTGGGTLLSKNRDWKPDHQQVLKRVHPRHGFTYFGLYAQDSDEPGIKAGVNEKGLSIVSASASSIPKSVRSSQTGKQGVMTRILVSYASVDTLMADASTVFSGVRAMFLMISDRRKIMLVEIGLDGAYVTKLLENGTLVHTNHYLDPQMTSFNLKQAQSSKIRLARISSLLAQAPQAHTLDRFITLSRDRHDGPDNSLWRTGKENTLASWIVAAPASGDATLRVVLANPGKPEEIHEFTLNQDFWKKR